MAVTLKDVGEKLGLSAVTVSCALRNTGDVAEPTRRRVLRAARELGYRPNAFARSVRTGRFGNVALTMSMEATWSQTPEPLLRGIERALAERDMLLTIAALPDEQLTDEGFVPKMLREWMADGLLINYNARIPARMVELIEQYELPSVWINSKHTGDCVYPDDYAAGREAACRLLALGHRRIAFVDFSSPPPDRKSHYSQIDRQQGYRDALAEAGLAGRRVGDRQSLGRGEIVSSLRAMLAEPRRPTAVVTYNMPEAEAAFMAAGLAGLEVPRDLSIITCCIGRAEGLGMIFANMVIPEQQLGKQAVTQLLTKIDDPSRQTPATAVPFTFDEGQSLGRPSGDDS